MKCSDYLQMTMLCVLQRSEMKIKHYKECDSKEAARMCCIVKSQMIEKKMFPLTMSPCLIGPFFSPP